MSIKTSLLLGLLAAGLVAGLFPVASTSPDAGERDPPFQDLQPSNGMDRFDFDIVDVRSWGLTTHEQYLLTSLEGLVNRDRARLYVIRGADDSRWLNDINEVPYNGTHVPDTSLSALVARYASHVNGSVIFDDLPESANIATPLVGIHGSLMVHASTWAVVSTWPGIAGKPVAANLTAEYASQGFGPGAHKADIYAWAFDRHFYQCNQSALGMFDAHNREHLRSMLAGHGIFTMWQPAYVTVRNDDGEIIRERDDDRSLACFEDIIARAPQDVIVYGYMFPAGANEHPVVSRLTTHGKYLVPSDWFRNMPFLAALPLPDDYQFSQPVTSPATLDSSKIYVAGIYSDGDNAQYIQWKMKSLWEERDDIGYTVPTSWELTPSIVRLAPALARYYYDAATTNDSFVCGVGGKGYTKAAFMTPAYFDIFWEDTRDLMNVLDMRVVRPWGGDFSGMVRIMNPSGATPQATGLIDGYATSGHLYPRLVGGVPLLGMLDFSGDDTTGEWNAMMEVRARKGADPVFITFHLHCWSTPYETWAAFATNLTITGDFIVVTADELVRLVLESSVGATAPGIHVLNQVLLWLVPGIVVIISTRKVARGGTGGGAP